MFFVIAVIAFIVAVISLIVYLVQMHRTKERYLGKDAVNRIADQAAKRAQRNTTVLTCDYCGGKIDTSVNKVCPQCGASYGQDKEWINRHSVDREKMEQNIDAGLKKNRNIVLSENAARMRKVKFLVIIITSFLVFVIAIVVLALTATAPKRHVSETVKEGFVRADYAFEDPVICDNESIRVEWGDIYYSPVSYTPQDDYDYEIEVKILNKSGKPGALSMDLAAINNSCIRSAMLYEEIGASDEVVRILDVPYYYYGEDCVKTLSVFDIRFMDDDYNLLYENRSVLEFETDRDYLVKEKHPEGNILFEKNGITVSAPTEGIGIDNLPLQITNEGDLNYVVSTYAALVNGKSDSLWLNYCLTPGSQAVYNLMDHIYLEEDEQLGSLQLQLEFKCPEDQTKDFVTDYITVPVEIPAEVLQASAG